MCRLFGLLSDPPVPAVGWLTKSDRALLRQASVAPEVRQADGWGIAWYDEERRTHVEKGTGCADDPSERDEFVDAAERAEGPLVLGHLRKASNPLGLSAEELRALANSQPFADGSTLFMHNGSISFPTETRERTGRYADSIQGVNDSEVLFALLLRHLEEMIDPAQAYARTVADLNEVWEMRGRAKPFPYSGLNVVLARGPRELWAFCHSLGNHGNGLLDASVPYYEMTFLAEPARIVVASERLDTTRNDWQPLRDGHYLVAQADRGEVKWRTAPIPWLAAIPAT